MKHNIYTDALVRLLILFVMSLLVCGIIGALCSCRTCRQESIVERSDTRENNERTDSTRHVSKDMSRILNTRIDSITVRDSVFMLVNGGNVFIDRYHFRDRTKMIGNDTTIIKSDTVYMMQTRTQLVTRTVTVNKTRTLPPVEVEKPLSWWNRTLIGIGYLAIGAVVASGVFLLRRLKK